MYYSSFVDEEKDKQNLNWIESECAQVDTNIQPKMQLVGVMPLEIPTRAFTVSNF